MKSMNVFRKVLFVLFTFASVSLVLSGCGYKPSSYYAKKELSGKVFVKFFVDLKDPRNAVIAKDTIYKALLQKLDTEIVNDESLADTVIEARIASVSMQELQYDKDGYNKLYRAVVALNINYTNKGERTRSFSLSGENNFSVDDGTTITDTKRFEAIREAAADALEEFLSKVAVQSFQE